MSAATKERRLSVAMLPELVDDSLLATSTVVIIDIFRASTTIIHALAHGARAIHPCLSVDDAQRIAATIPTQQRLLGGERGGVKIAGFDLGNSPFEYTPDVVQGKDIVFTTTNGTKALNRCQEAKQIVIGGFVNISAISELIRCSTDDVLLACAGTDGHLTAEDILFAGSLVEMLLRDTNHSFQLDIGADISRDFAQRRSKTEHDWHAAMRTSRGGANLIALGYERDIARSIERDRFEIVPMWDCASRTLILHQ